MPVGLAALSLCLFLGAQAAHGGAAYRWVDEHGHVHYGDRPPAGTAPETLQLPSARGAEDPNAAARRARRQRLLEVLDEEREERKARAEEQRRLASERRRRCEQARRRQFDYAHAGYIYERDAEGNRHILDDAGHERVRREAREAVARWCD